MKASVRILNPLSSTGVLVSKPHRQSLSLTLRHGRNLYYHHHRSFVARLTCPLSLPDLHPSRNETQFRAINGKPVCSARAHSSLSIPFSNSLALGLLLSGFSSPVFHSHHQNNPENFNFFNSDSNDDSFSGRWSGALHSVHQGGAVTGDSDRLVMTVLLGWLGAQPKHLKRYAEIYASRGINTVTFVVPVSEVLWFDLGTRIENRIEQLVNEIVAWLMVSEKDGRERCLVFHTFSNTGWLAYGAILSRLQGRPELMKRIRGCIVDSGGDPELNPQVWAAGFAAAMLKKRSSAVYPVGETGEMASDSIPPKLQEKGPDLIENMLLFVLEKLFSFLLNLPDVNKRLSKTIASLSENRPSCPQLYLYSTADKVIPFFAVESFVEEQKKMGRKVWSFNFQSSPHVDHFRTFPDLYSSKLSSFLDECLATVEQV